MIDGSLVLTLAAPRSGAYVHSDYGPGSCTLPVGGYAEARIFFPGSASEGIYNWPAWWVFGPNWPEAGEHDVAEGLHGKLTVNYHSGKTSAPTQLNLGMVPGTWRNAFHTYGVRRGKTSADVYWDGQLVKSYPTSDNGAPEELVFDVGAFGPPHVADESQVKVDYVRVWHCASGCANR